MKLDDISFDESYKNLFQVDDARLRADALKHSVVPRLCAVLNECISLVKDTYDVDALDDSRVSWFPQFRPKREKDLAYLYDSAYAGLGGKQSKEKWHGFSRKNGKVVQLLPFRYGLMLEEDGLYVRLDNYWLKGLTDESHRKLFDFHIEYESLIHSLCYRTNIEPVYYYGESCEPISTLKEHYDWMAEHRHFDNYFISKYVKYPISSDDLYSIVVDYVIFYPVYDSYIQIAMGKPVRFIELVGMLNQWLRNIDKLSENEPTSDELTFNRSDDDLARAKVAAEQRVRVMPSIRWQVFQRDNWKCVACGRNSHDNIILHIDHIIARSKGGKDTLDNYQTLCNLCNIGKSNRDATNLRHKREEKTTGAGPPT